MTEKVAEPKPSESLRTVQAGGGSFVKLIPEQPA